MFMGLNYLKNYFYLEKYYLNYFLLLNLFYEVKKLKNNFFNFLKIIYLNWFLMFFYLNYLNYLNNYLANCFLFRFIFCRPSMQYFLLPLTNLIKKFSILRSPFVHKKSWDQLEYIKRQLIFFINLNYYSFWHSKKIFYKNKFFNIFVSKKVQKKLFFLFSCYK